jgi:hypothetical protein
MMFFWVQEDRILRVATDGELHPDNVSGQNGNFLCRARVRLIPDSQERRRSHAKVPITSDTSL